MKKTAGNIGDCKHARTTRRQMIRRLKRHQIAGEWRDECKSTEYWMELGLHGPSKMVWTRGDGRREGVRAAGRRAGSM